MDIPNLKTLIIEMASRIKSGIVSDEDLVDFFDENRKVFMAESSLVETSSPRAISFITCSCGSREDSCEEDGNGTYSQFFLTLNGDIERVKMTK